MASSFGTASARSAIRRRAARCRELIRGVNGGGPRRRICASYRRSFGRRRRAARQSTNREFRLEGRAASPHPIGAPAVWCLWLKPRLGRLATRPAHRARCSRSIESGDCANKRQCRLDRIEEAVLGGLREELKNPAVIEAARRGFAEEWARLSKERSRESAEPSASYKMRAGRRPDWSTQSPRAS